MAARSLHGPAPEAPANTTRHIWAERLFLHHKSFTVLHKTFVRSTTWPFGLVRSLNGTSGRIPRHRPDTRARSNILTSMLLYCTSQLADGTGKRQFVNGVEQGETQGTAKLQKKWNTGRIQMSWWVRLSYANFCWVEWQENGETMLGCKIPKANHVSQEW